MMDKHHFAHSPQNEFCDFNVLPPCSAGKTLTAVGIPRDKRFPALLSKFMALRRQIENKKGDFYRAVFEHGVGELTCCYY